MKNHYKLLIAAILGVACLFSIGVFTGVKLSHYDIEANHLKECELKYWETKSLLTDEVQNYINKVAPTSDLRASALIDACEEYSIEVKFALAQGEIESHFGTKGLAVKTNSVWNVGAFTNASFGRIMSIYKYSHPNESIRPYLDLIYRRYMTTEAEAGLLKKFIDHDGNRFASDKNYEERLFYKYKQIGQETKIDSLTAQLHYWAIKANR